MTSTSPYILRLAHMNDSHSQLDPYLIPLQVQLKELHDVQVSIGGFARLKTRVEQLKNQSKAPFLCLHAGDVFQGSLYFNHYKGLADAELLNHIGIDAMTLGNHDLDSGSELLKPFLDAVQFPVLAGNMDTSHEEKDKSLPLHHHAQLIDFDSKKQLAKVLLKPFHDTKIAIVGITLDKMHDIAVTDADLVFHNAVETTRRTVEHLKKQNLHHIIVLSHLGLPSDRLLAKDVSGISLIVGGHSHSLQGDFGCLGLPKKLSYAECVNDTPILHAGAHTQALGQCDIQFDIKGKVIQLSGQNELLFGENLYDEIKQQVPLSCVNEVYEVFRSNKQCLELTSNTIIEKILTTKYRPPLEKLNEQVLIHLKESLTHSRLPSKKMPQGSQLAPLVAQSFFEQAKKEGVAVDFALHNAGGVRRSLLQGNIRYAHVAGEALPFNLHLVCFQIQGKWIKEALESAINHAINHGVQGTGTGSFPYTYALRYWYDASHIQGQRIQKIEIFKNDRWCRFDMHKSYSVVSSDFTLSGKEGYQALQNYDEKSVLQGKSTSSFIDWLKRQSQIDLAEPTVYFKK